MNRRPSALRVIQLAPLLLLSATACKSSPRVTPELRWNATGTRLEAAGHETREWIELVEYSNPRIGIDAGHLPAGTRVALGSDQLVVGASPPNTLLIDLEPLFANVPVTVLTSGGPYQLPMQLEVQYPNASNKTRVPLAVGMADRIVEKLRWIVEAPVVFDGEPPTNMGAVVLTERQPGQFDVEVIGAAKTVGELGMVALVDDELVDAKDCGRYEGDGVALRSVTVSFIGRRARVFDRRTGKLIVKKTFHGALVCPGGMMLDELPDGPTVRSGVAEARAWLAKRLARQT